MTQISFKGTLITNMNVRKAGYTLPTHKVSIVRVNPNNEADLRALREVEDSWQGNFTKQIYKDAERINSGIIPEFPETFFIMTKQKDKFSKLNPDDILAEAKIIRDFPLMIFGQISTAKTFYPSKKFSKKRKVFH